MDEIHELVLLGERMRLLRVMHGYTQKELAHELDMSQSNYSKMERGITDPGYIILLKLFIMYDMRIQDIISFDPKKYKISAYPNVE